MKSLIVNGDDFGASRGINRGVIEAHRRGILTSASLMVDAPASAEAAHLSSRHPTLGIGLHAVLGMVAGPLTPEAEIERQIERFIELTGQLPTHIDTHHNVHDDKRLLPAFLATAQRYKLPLRGHCGVRHIGGFYGQWDGETHLEHVSPHALEHVVTTEVEDGFNELCCHPGVLDGELASSYLLERETELETLCDPAISALLSDQRIRLVTFREVPQP